MSMPTTTTHPVTFEEFKAVYLEHLGDPDNPNCHIAYMRAEADMVTIHGQRRYANHKTFRNTMSRYDSARRTAAQPNPENPQKNTWQIPIKCQICETELYRVPRGDLRTIIPHFCEECRVEIKRLIFG